MSKYMRDMNIFARLSNFDQLFEKKTLNLFAAFCHNFSHIFVFLGSKKSPNIFLDALASLELVITVTDNFFVRYWINQ